jgi:radical SAM protein with 4Fe4S-binding SPASM domain
MYDILSKINIDRWQIDNAYLAGRFVETGTNSPNWIETAKEGFKYIVTDYLKNYPQVPQWRLEIVGVFRYDSLFFGFSPASSTLEHPCSYHFGSVIVERGNEVRFCPSLRTLALGRLENKSLTEVYEQNSDFKDFLSKTIEDLPCHECKYSRIFHGGCRANSWAYSGKIWDRDPLCCALSPFVEDEIIPLFPIELQKQFTASLEGYLRPDKPGHPVFEANASVK